MNIILEKAYIILWIIIPVILIFGLINSEKTIDVNIYDTYYVVNTFHFAIFLSTYFTILGLVYFGINYCSLELNKKFTNIHVIGSILSIAIIFILNFLYRTNLNQNVFEIINNEKFNNKVTLVIILFICCFIISQIVFIFNIIQSFVKK
jgi:heme/copper-type cytochrome/quinol oxidase subunit 1